MKSGTSKTVFWLWFGLIAALWGQTSVYAQTSAKSVPDWLPGWWVAIDDAYLPLLMEGKMTPHFGLMIINSDGTVEERMVGLQSATVSVCRQLKICSDAPKTGASTVAVEDDRLLFSGWTPSTNVIDVEPNDHLLREKAIAFGGPWTFALQGSGRTMELTRDRNEKRSLVKLEPDELRRLWGAHWFAGGKLMCLIKNAQSNPPAKGSVVDMFLRAASYSATMSAYYGIDGLDELPGSLANRPELFMVERFDDLAAATTKEEQELLQLRYVLLKLRSTPTTNQAEVDEVINKNSKGREVKLDLSADEIKALGEPLSPELVSFFCL